MSGKQPYTSPRLYRHDPQTAHPTWIRDAVTAIRSELDALHPTRRQTSSQIVTVLDSDRRYVEVSDAFCRLVGYDRKELIGKQLDELTAPDSNDTPINFALLSRIGYMQGLWMFITRHNTRVLVRYESWLRPDSNIERHLEPVAANL